MMSITSATNVIPARRSSRRRLLMPGYYQRRNRARHVAVAQVTPRRYCKGLAFSHAVMYGRFVLLIAFATLAASCGSHGPTAPDAPLPPPVGTTPVPPAEPPNPAQPPPPPPSPPEPLPTLSRTRFLAFGDSITAGTISPALTRIMSAGLPESYPYKLQSVLRSRYTAQDINISNEGLAAERAEDGVRRLPGLLRTLSPEVVILLEGVNDLVSTSAVPRAVGFVNTMARDARFSGATVFLCTLPPQRPGGFRALNPTLVSSFNAGLRDIARGEGAVLVDFNTQVDLNLIGVDGLHPTETGYERMAQILFGLIRTQFER